MVFIENQNIKYILPSYIYYICTNVSLKYRIRNIPFRQLHLNQLIQREAESVSERPNG